MMVERLRDHLAVLVRHFIEHAYLQRPWKLVTSFYSSAECQEPACCDDCRQLFVGMCLAQITGSLDHALEQVLLE